jgi:large subunit ribosomal protein L25
MKSVALNASLRSAIRRSANKSLRSSGRIPAVIYGAKTTPQNLEVDAKELDTAIHHSASENVLVDLNIQADKNPKRLALVQDVQHHPLSGKVLHVDFHEVHENERVVIFVPVETTGEPVGVKTGGGVLSHVTHKIKVRALPKDLPELIVIDVTALELNRAIHLGEVKAPAGVEILGHKEVVVVACTPPRAEEEVAAPAEGAPAAGDVEMIKEKKEEGAEGAAPAKAGDKAAAKPGDKAAAPAAAAKDEKKPAAEKKK